MYFAEVKHHKKNIYHGIIYPLLLYGVSVWGNAYKILLEPIYIMQKTFVRMATYNDSYPGPLVSHTSLIPQTKGTYNFRHL